MKKNEDKKLAENRKFASRTTAPKVAQLQISIPGLPLALESFLSLFRSFVLARTATTFPIKRLPLMKGRRRLWGQLKIGHGSEE